jgi:LysM repeat protein
MQKLRSSIVLMMIAIAIILAAGVFLTMNVINGRNNDEQLPEAAANNFWVTVGTEQVALQVDPNQRLTIVEVPVAEQNNSPRVEPTSDPQVVEATTIPEATAVPNTPLPATAVPPPTVAKIIFIDYLVQQGDTLYSITQRIDTSIALMADKGLSQASLNPGQVIRLPIGNPEYCAGRGRPYAVGEGDTAFNISQRFNTTPENLRTTNSLNEAYTVKVADIICVP